MIKFETKVRFRGEARGRKRLEKGPTTEVEKGRVPRVSRMMALAIRFDGLIRSGVVKDQADLARLGGVSRARTTQIMSLLNLSPDIQEALLFLPRIEKGKEPIREKDLRPIAAEEDWAKQRHSAKCLQITIDWHDGQEANLFQSE